MTGVYWLIFFIAQHRVLTGAALIAVAVAIAVLLVIRRRRIAAGAAIATAIVLAMVNGFLGSGLANALVYQHGLAGQARDVGSHNTFAKLNKNSAWIYAYTVLITGADGQVIRTEFRAYDTILYPRFDGAITSADYPSKLGDVFDVRYLPGHPDAFVIVTDDESPWASGHRCDGFVNAVGDLKYKFDPDPTNPQYRPQYSAAIRALIASGCVTDADQIQTLRQTLAGLGQ